MDSACNEVPALRWYLRRRRQRSFEYGPVELSEMTLAAAKEPPARCEPRAQIPGTDVPLSVAPIFLTRVLLTRVFVFRSQQGSLGPWSKALRLPATFAILSQVVGALDLNLNRSLVLVEVKWKKTPRHTTKLPGSKPPITRKLTFWVSTAFEHLFPRSLLPTHLLGRLPAYPLHPPQSLPQGQFDFFWRSKSVSGVVSS